MSETSNRPIFRKHPWQGPSVIVAKEHGCDNRYWDATTLEAFRFSALAILRERESAGYFYVYDFDPDPLVDLTEEQAALLPPESPTRSLHEKQVSRLAEHRRYVAAELKWRTRKDQALAENDGDMAWFFLTYGRGNSEDEQVRLEKLNRGE